MFESKSQHNEVNNRIHLCCVSKVIRAMFESKSQGSVVEDTTFY